MSRKMGEKRRLWRMMALALVFGLALAGCGGEEEDSAPSYRVRFEVDGGSAVADQTVERGEKVTRPADPSKDGHTFADWYRDADKTILWNFDVDVINEPTTIYAKWVAGTVTAYTVTFNADGGTPAPGSQRVLQGEKVAEPFAPAKEGHIFDGWYTGATAWNFGTDTVSADITLTAGWVESYGGTKTLIITGIDSDVQSQGSKDYTVGVFPIGTPDEDIMTDVLTGSQIQYAVAGDDDRATLLPVQSSNLIVYLEDMETGQPWTGAGTFKVAFILFDGDTVYIYTVDDIRIVSPYTPITMSQFIKIIDFPFSK